METRHLNLDYGYFSDRSELPEEDRQLLEAAAKACSTAYAPYSDFRVGAAVRFDDGEILTSSNQESEAFPSGICAERGLLYFVQANRPQKKIRTLAIISSPAPTECTPCGACRQVIADTEQRQKTPIRILMGGSRSTIVVESAQSLLPFRFTLTPTKD